MTINKSLLLLLFGIFLSGPLSADIYVSKEDQLKFAEGDVVRELRQVPASERRAMAREMYRNIPNEREELERKIEDAKAKQERGEPGPPVYMLRKGRDGFDNKEMALTALLENDQHEVWTASQFENRNRAINTEEKPQKVVSTRGQKNDQAVDSAPSSPSAQPYVLSVAVVLLGAAGLIAVRRFLNK
jgi:hypothetical protein